MTKKRRSSRSGALIARYIHTTLKKNRRAVRKGTAKALGSGETHEAEGSTMRGSRSTAERRNHENRKVEAAPAEPGGGKIFKGNHRAPNRASSKASAAG